MSQESVSNKAQVASYLAFPAATLGWGVTSSVIRNKGVTGAIKSLHRSEFKNLSNELGKDVFSKSEILAQNYEACKTLSKTAAKTRVGLFGHIKNGFGWCTNGVKNIFRKLTGKETKVFDKITKEGLKANSEAAKKELEENLGKIASGESITAKAAETAAKEGTQAAATAAKAGLGTTIKNAFKSEIKNPFVIGISVLATLPKIKSQIVPAFKEKGFLGGVKETGKVLIRAAADFFSYAFGGVVGKIAGGAIGTLICPGAGSAMGAKIGSMIGAMVSGSAASKVVDKVIGKEQEPDTTPEEEAQDIATSKEKKLDMEF